MTANAPTARRGPFRPRGPHRTWPPAMPGIRLHGLALMDAELAWSVDWLADRLAARTPIRAAFVNARRANAARRDPDYSAVLATADAVLPDGSGAPWRPGCGDGASGAT